MSTREETQSIAVNREEKLLIEILALANGLKPATLARSLLFRGLRQFIADGQVRESGILEDEIKQKLLALISEDPTLLRAAEITKKKQEGKSRASESQPGAESEDKTRQAPKKKSPIRIVGVIPGQIFDDAPKKKSVVEEKPGKKK